MPHSRVHPYLVSLSRQCLTLESISHQVVMCAHFCQVSEATPLSGINQFLSPDKFPCSSSPMLSKSPVKVETVLNKCQKQCQIHYATSLP